MIAASAASDRSIAVYNHERVFNFPHLIESFV